MPNIDLSAWTTVSPLLDLALTLGPAERARLLEATARSNPAAAAMLERLLTAHEQLSDSDFLEWPSVAPVAPPGMAGTAVGAYTLDSLLGAGGMGVVWKAHRSDGRYEGAVAIKLLQLAAMSPAGAARFTREGSLLARLAHPHIARLFDAGVAAAGQPYLVLEYVEGQHIDRYCDEQRLDVAARLGLFQQVCHAVAHAHAQLVVHRDLKPSNILVDAAGQVKLLDFGIAAMTADADAPANTAATAARGFTPEYAAPEQVTGGAISTATDVHALGVLLYVLLTGRHPLHDVLGSPAALLGAIADVDPPPMSATAAAEGPSGAADGVTSAAAPSRPLDTRERAEARRIDSRAAAAATSWRSRCHRRPRAAEVRECPLRVRGAPGRRPRAAPRASADCGPPRAAGGPRAEVRTAQPRRRGSWRRGCRGARCRHGHRGLAGHPGGRRAGPRPPPAGAR